jgi:hypothetical protein
MDLRIYNCDNDDEVVYKESKDIFALAEQIDYYLEDICTHYIYDTSPTILKKIIKKEYKEVLDRLRSLYPDNK